MTHSKTATQNTKAPLSATRPLSATQLSRAVLRGTLTKAQIKRIFYDGFIREVRVNYQPIPEPAFRIRMAEDVACFVRKILVDNSREHFIALFLDGAHQVAGYSIVSIGTANYALVHPRELFQRAIGAGAVSIAVAHNHPSGNLEPSTEDRQLTTRLKEAGDLLDIRLLDHVIVAESGYYSFSEQNLL